MVDRPSKVRLDELTMGWRWMGMEEGLVGAGGEGEAERLGKAGLELVLGEERGKEWEQRVGRGCQEAATEGGVGEGLERRQTAGCQEVACVHADVVKGDAFGIGDGDHLTAAEGRGADQDGGCQICREHVLATGGACGIATQL